MAARTVTITLEVELVVSIEEGFSEDTVVQELNYNFDLDEEYGEVVRSEIQGYNCLPAKEF